MPEITSSLIPSAEWGKTVFAFRGYNVTNLGRTAELLNHATYGPVVRDKLAWASDVCADIAGRSVNLVKRVEEAKETDLDTFDEAVAMIVAVELAHIEILERFVNYRFGEVEFAFGYSLGEVAALAASGLIEPRDAIAVPLSVAADCSKLAADVSMGVVFSRLAKIDVDFVRDLCRDINQQGRGVIAISSHLAPNALLVLGEGDTVKRFKELATAKQDAKIHVRENSNKWPPLHTPILWREHVPSRAGLQIITMPAGKKPPSPRVLALSERDTFYDTRNYAELLDLWIDHPQRLWAGVYRTLQSGAETVVHVGPEPNLAPATYKRLADNVNGQMIGSSLYSLGMWAMSRNPWLAQMIVTDACLLRGPYLRQVILEDWLLDRPVEVHRAMEAR